MAESSSPGWAIAVTAAALFGLGVLAGTLMWPKDKSADHNTVAWASQQLKIMYLIVDDMYRARFFAWLKTQQAQEYAQVIRSGVQGNIWTLPFNDPARMKDLLASLNETLGSIKREGSK